MWAILNINSSRDFSENNKWLVTAICVMVYFVSISAFLKTFNSMFNVKMKMDDC